MKIPKRVARCTTHYICDCLQWRMEQMESALKVIHTWASAGSEWLEPHYVTDLCNKALQKGDEHHK